MNIVFMGTPDFAVESLVKIHQSSHRLVAVVTAPDKPAGRGKKLTQSAVKIKADELGIPTLQPTNLKSPDFIEQLSSFQADLFVVVAFRMLPTLVWKLPPKGTINLHASLLPDYRGAAPINRAIMNGEKETGATTFFIREEIDTGDIILQERCPIHYDDNAGDLHDRLMIIGSDLLVKTLDLIEKGEISPMSQEQFVLDPVKVAPKIFKEDCKIDWNLSAEFVYHFIRGLSPYPGAWSTLTDEEGVQRMVKFYKTSICVCDKHPSPGSLSIEKDKLLIGCADAWLEIKELQMEGKKRLDCKAFLLGCKLSNRCQFS
jgi:methionyl-tRNA formyltransferase